MLIFKYIEMIKQKNQFKKDNQVAKLLDLSPTTISLIKKGQSVRAKTAIKIAAELKIEPYLILLDAAIQETNNEEERNAWLKLKKRLQDGDLAENYSKQPKRIST